MFSKPIKGIILFPAVPTELNTLFLIFLLKVYKKQEHNLKIFQTGLLAVKNVDFLKVDGLATLASFSLPNINVLAMGVLADGKAMTIRYKT